MPRGKNEVTVPIDLNEIDANDLRAYVESKYAPEDMFDEDALAEWAMENGFIHRDDIR